MKSEAPVQSAVTRDHESPKPFFNTTGEGAFFSQSPAPVQAFFQPPVQRVGGEPKNVSRKTPNKTGLPDPLKSGVESLSGLAMDDVKVHYNSPQPAQLHAHAYAQGNQIHIAPGQEQHLPHEAWHVVQQKQGRVKPTMQMKGKVNINDDAGLEREAEVMGRKAMQMQAFHHEVSVSAATGSSPIQRFQAPPAAPPGAGQRGFHPNGHHIPDESHITTPHGIPNNLVGTVPGGTMIPGWQFILNVGASGPWIRFHMINENIGGLGSVNNLIPTSHATNHDAAWRNFERTCIHFEGQDIGIHVTVEAQFHAPVPGAVVGSRDANQHFYPNLIRGRCYVWNGANYVLNGNGAPANQQTFQVTVNPFPLLPPVNAIQTDLTQQTAGWLRNTLLAGNITGGQATTLLAAFQGNYMGDDIDDYINMSNEPTDEMQLLDAIDSFLAVELQLGIAVPMASRVHIFNGTYHI